MDATIEIKANIGVDRTTRRWIAELNKLMGVYLFGADALRIM
ncbi:hypothetical protein RO787_27625 [Blautia coccoides]|nr:hypothetical protein [Blautia coccoides]MDT4377100.1 hypothetical protein [Blautia coccoides]